MIYAPDHPLAGKSSYIPKHRAILWDRIGPGAHACCHCGMTVTWQPGAHTKRGALVVDHLDRDSHNNDPANLAPSCHACNSRNQEAGVVDDEPHRVRSTGSRLRGEQRPCERCGNLFVVWKDSRPGRGRFCSRSCARSKPALPH